jgi:hypothetical protein
MSELKIVENRLTFPEDLSMQDCINLTAIEASLKGFCILMTYPITTIAELKLTLFKHGFTWIVENGYIIMRSGNDRLAKIQFYTQLINLNPNLPEMSKEIKIQLFEVLNTFPEHFSISERSYKLTKETLVKWLKIEVKNETLKSNI